MKKNEINKDFYCSAGCWEEGNKCIVAKVCLSGCENYRHKHPTPEQYMQEYGEKVPDDMPVWVLCGRKDKNDIHWEVHQFGEIRDFINEYIPEAKGIIVVACTPFDKPDNDWRP